MCTHQCVQMTRVRTKTRAGLILRFVRISPFSPRRVYTCSPPGRQTAASSVLSARPRLKQKRRGASPAPSESEEVGADYAASVEAFRSWSRTHTWAARTHFLTRPHPGCPASAQDKHQPSLPRLLSSIPVFSSSPPTSTFSLTLHGSWITHMSTLKSSPSILPTSCRQRFQWDWKFYWILLFFVDSIV